MSSFHYPAGKHNLVVPPKPPPTVIGEKELFKFVICVVLYLFFGNLLIDDDSGTESSSNTILSTLLEHGDIYVFMITSALLFSIFTLREIGFKAPQFVLLMFDTFATIFLTNITIKLFWTQVVKFSDFTVKALADLVGKLHQILKLEFLNSVAAWLDKSGHYLAAIIAFILLLWVMENLYVFQHIKYQLSRLFKKPEIQCPYPSLSLSHDQRSPRNKLVRRRGDRQHPNNFTDDSDSDYDPVFIAPINGPLLAD